MSDIALFGSIIVPLGLAASTFSSALGSVMVGPRTLQAIALDNSLRIRSANRWVSKMRGRDHEPVNASVITCTIALVFVAIGGVDIVAQIITMFSGHLWYALPHLLPEPLRLITILSTLFPPRWYISLLGFIAAVWVMFQISLLYTLIAFTTMILLYLYLDNYHSNRRGFAALLPTPSSR